MIRNKLIIICGKAFSGKTYLGKEIERRLGFRRIAFDEIWVELDSAKDNDQQMTHEYVAGEVEMRITSLLRQ